MSDSAGQGTGEGSPSRLGRLPPGRHGLPREFVEENQRHRIAAGMIATVGEHGYHDATVARVVDAAGVSRRAFYTHYSSKEECYLETYDMIAAFFRETVADATTGDEPWPERVRAKIAAMLEVFAANPDLARFTLVAPTRAGDKIAERYRQGVANVLRQVKEGMPPPPEVEPPPENVQFSLVAGMATLIVNRVEAGEGERLPELVPHLVEYLLAPFIGRDEALRVARAEA
jgi:AcrR family transcriptional regulator